MPAQRLTPKVSTAISQRMRGFVSQESRSFASGLTQSANMKAERRSKPSRLSPPLFFGLTFESSVTPIHRRRRITSLANGLLPCPEAIFLLLT